ncbi:MAG TPA: SIMPL domain-containing protein [Terriglobales bacterium]|nr:SIMPL domain-containing protein [Terriglobales bacterium]
MRQVASLLCVLMLTMLAEAQDRAIRPTDVLSSITVEADGQVEAEPDVAQMRFDISAQDQSARNAYEKVAKTSDQIRTILRSNGVDSTTAEVGSLYFQPLIEYKKNKRKIVAYRVKSAVTLKLRDFAKVGAILQQLSEGDITDSQSLNYILSSLDSAKTRAAENAMQKALREATSAAKAAGATVGSLISATVDVRQQIRPLLNADSIGKLETVEVSAGMASAQPPPPPPTAEFTPQSVSISAHVRAIFSLK